MRPFITALLPVIAVIVTWVAPKTLVCIFRNSDQLRLTRFNY